MTRRQVFFVVTTLLTSMISAIGQSRPQKDLSSELTTAKLVQRYVRADPMCHECRKKIEPAILAKDPDEVFSAIATLFDNYDPRTTAGKNGKRSPDAYWAASLIHSIDNNHTRVRAYQSGRKAIESYHQMLIRMEEAGYRDTKATGGMMYSMRQTYRGNLLQYQELIGVNGCDVRIAYEFKQKSKAQMSDEEKKRFSDFLVSMDPNYVRWVKYDTRKGFADMSPFYRAYSEFKTSTVDK